MVDDLDQQPNEKARTLELIDIQVLIQGKPCEFSYEVPCNIAICKVMITGFKKSMRGQLQLFVDDVETPKSVFSLKKMMNGEESWLGIHGLKGLVKAVIYIEQGTKIPENFSISIRYYLLDEIINN